MIAVGTSPRRDGSCSGEDEVPPDGISTELLEEGEEIGGVVGVYSVAANTLSAGVLPAGSK